MKTNFKPHSNLKLGLNLTSVWVTYTEFIGAV